jgi:hypothetical protein
MRRHNSIKKVADLFFFFFFFFKFIFLSFHMAPSQVPPFPCSNCWSPCSPDDGFRLGSCGCFMCGDCPAPPVEYEAATAGPCVACGVGKAHFTWVPAGGDAFHFGRACEALRRAVAPGSGTAGPGAGSQGTSGPAAQGSSGSGSNHGSSGADANGPLARSAVALDPATELPAWFDLGDAALVALRCEINYHYVLFLGHEPISITAGQAVRGR